MLQEIQIAQGKKTSPQDRWYTDRDFDLFVWGVAGDRIAGFQLCYDKQSEERALTWLEAAGFSHDRIDSGEQHPTRNMTPVLLPDGLFPYARIKTLLDSVMGNIESRLSTIIMERLREYAERTH